ncbi:RAD55 family ATPase [Methanolobus bombayensis]|uniref:RAD55 family ATPase n=1 Tax=Methanolobus bombayensis TaxID=38023 RepID=UPI001AE54D7E|nr:ATPase domain-containing protein [Methanolobus bombayensis]MBP1910454.1 KaiC/GvpD/RAD55 family RecA-like ATPase [Methanolobus bombayensis]
MARISSGISDLDKRLQGGFPEGECILITGKPGTGKTIFGIQFLYSACLEGKKCIMIATEETPEKIVEHGKALGFDLEPYTESNQLTMIRFFEMRVMNMEEGADSFTCMNIDTLNNLTHIINDEVDVIVLDNMGTFSIGVDLKTFKEELEVLSFLLSAQKRTSLIIMDAAAHEFTHNIAEYSTYGTIRLMFKENPYTGKMERFMFIPKMRGTKITLELINYDITEDGIKLFSPKTNR